MLTPIPPSRVLHEWGAISAGLRRAVTRDPKANWLDMLGMAISGQMQFFRSSGPAEGFVALEVQREPGTMKRALLIVYAGGQGSNAAAMRAVLDAVELRAFETNCSEVKFEGRRGWARLFPDYQTSRGEDGRQRYRKAIT